MKVKFKKLNPKAKAPTQAHEDDAGYDLYAVSQQWSVQQATGVFVEYSTGLAFEIPKGYVICDGEQFLDLRVRERSVGVFIRRCDCEVN